jgi:hypothetical protein
MTHKPSQTQKTTPKGIDPKTGKLYEPVKREEWNRMLRRAAGQRKQS